MSVVVTVRFAGDPAGLERAIKADPDRLMRVIEDAKKHGVLHHRFVGGQGEFLVIDEWPAAENFEAFFGGQQEIQELMQDAGVTADPQVMIWHSLETPDQM